MPDPLVFRLKQLIVTTLHLEDIRPEDIGDETPLVDSGLSFDSLDSLELSVQVEKEFGLKINSNDGAKIAYGSVADLARYLRARVPADRLPV